MAGYWKIRNVMVKLDQVPGEGWLKGSCLGPGGGRVSCDWLVFHSLVLHTVGKSLSVMVVEEIWFCNLFLFLVEARRRKDAFQTTMDRKWGFM